MRRPPPLFIIALLASTNALAADYGFTVQPAQPKAGQPFQIRVTKTFDPCGFPLPSSLAAQDLGQNVIRYSIPGGDGCERDVPAQDITYTLPPLSAGTYTFRFAVCGLFPVDCQTLQDQQVVVASQATGAPFAIPALSPWAGFALAVLMAGGGLKTKTRRSGGSLGSRWYR